MSAPVAVLDQLRVVNAGKTVQWNTDFEIVPVADIEETLHAYLRAEVSESFRGPVPFVERVFGERRLQGGSLRRLRPVLFHTLPPHGRKDPRASSEEWDGVSRECSCASNRRVITIRLSPDRLA